MFMLITVCDNDIDTYIVNTLELAQEKMLEKITNVFEDNDRLDWMEDWKGEDWDTGDMYGWINYEVNDSEYAYKIVKLPSLVVDLI